MKRKYITETKTKKCGHCPFKINGIEKYYMAKKRTKNKDIKQIEIKITKVYVIALPDFCDNCKDLPRCKNCDIIMCQLKKHLARQSVKKPQYCSDCVDRLLC